MAAGRNLSSWPGCGGGPAFESKGLPPLELPARGGDSKFYPHPASRQGSPFAPLVPTAPLFPGSVLAPLTPTFFLFSVQARITPNPSPKKEKKRRGGDLDWPLPGGGARGYAAAQWSANPNYSNIFTQGAIPWLKHF